MKKSHKILLWSGGIVVAIATTGYFGMNYAVDRAMDAFVASALQAELDSVTGSVSSPAASDKPKSSPSPAAADGGKEEKSSNPASSANDVPKEQEGNQAAGNDDKKTASGQKDTPGTTYDPSISAEQAKKVQESITAKEKARVSSILLKKLSASDISTFMNLSKGGLTNEEKEEAKKIVMQKLSEDEYNELIAIAAKYGLSQGKSYKETSK